MARRQPLPRLLLMTDERMGEALWLALERLPRGSGVVVRHRATAAKERRRLFDRVRAVARRRGLVVLLAGSVRHAIGWRADGVHGPAAGRRAPRPILRSAPAHDAGQLAAAARNKVDLVLLSPVFATRSHPNGVALGVVRWGLLATGRPSGPRLLALGGITVRNFRRLQPLGAEGWAAIDGLGADQNLKVVPR